MLIVLFTVGFSAAQSINSTPVIINVSNSAANNIVTVYMIHNPLDTFNITVSYKGEGSAILGHDFLFTPLAPYNAVQHQFQFQFNIINPNIKRKTIIFDIKAKGKDTILYSKLEVILTNNTNREITHPFDTTNTPKLEFVNYTDFKGFDQDAPNGVAQSQFLFKIPINHRKIQLNKENYYLQLFRSIVLPNFLFNRIDKTNKGVTAKLNENKYGDSITYSKYISSFDFITKANFVLNGKLAVLTLMMPKSRLQLQAIGSIFKIKVDSMEVTRAAANTVDSTTKIPIGFNPIYATSIGTELYFDTHYSPDEFPFNFRFVADCEWITMRSGEYIQADIASILPDNSRRTVKIVQNDPTPIVTFSAMIKKNLGLKKTGNDDHYLFFRYNYSWQKFKANVPIANRPGRYEMKMLYNNFSQFQLGIDLNFDGFFKN